MSFLAPKVETKGLSPSTPARVADWREAEVLPFGNGYFRVAPKWITDRFNNHWSNGSQTGQAFCSIAGWLCHGPVDRIRGIYNNGELHLLLEVVRAPGQYYTEFTFGGIDRQLGVTNRGRIYWGLEDQPADAWLLANTGQDHPPYSGICYIIFERLHLGEIRANTQAQPPVPNIEVSLSRLPSPDLPEGLQLPDDVTEHPVSGVNWVSALFDAISHPRAGIDGAHLLDEEQWAAAAAAVQEGTKTVSGRSGADAYLAPLHATRQDLEQVIADYLSYVDGFTFARAGLVAIDWFANDGSAVGSLPQITEADMSEDPEISDSTLADAPSTVLVKGLSDTELADAAEPYPVQLVRAMHGDHRTVQLDRPWIVQRHRLRMYGAQYAARAISPRASGRLTVFRSRAIRLDGTALRPGDQFRLLWPKQGRDLVCRVIEREEQELGAVVTLLFRGESGNVVLPGPPDDPDPYTPPDMGTYPCDDFAVMRAPTELGSGVVVLARRSESHYANLEVLIDPDGTWSGGSQSLGQQGFAAQAELQGGINSAVETVTVYGTDEDVGPLLGSGMTGAEQSDNTMLLVIGDEWMSIGAVSSVGADTYEIAVLRGRLGSGAVAHADESTVRIIRRADLTVWNHALLTDGATRSFKVRAVGAGGALSIVSCPKTVTTPGECRYYYCLLPIFVPPTIAIFCKQRGGTASLCGIEEYTSPSTPPKKYRRQTITGGWCDEDNSVDLPTGNCAGPSVNHAQELYGGSYAYDRHTCATVNGQVFRSGFDPFAVSCAAVAVSAGPQPGENFYPYYCLPNGNPDTIWLPAISVNRTPTLVTWTAGGFCVDGLTSVDYFGVIHYNSRTINGFVTKELTEEDTEDDALARLEATLDDWSELEWDLCEALPCCGSSRSVRTTGFSVDVNYGRVLVQASGFAGEAVCILRVHVWRTNLATLENEAAEDQFYTVSSSVGGDAEWEFELPNVAGYNYYVKNVTFHVLS